MPFCESCQEQHRRELPVVSPWARFRLACRSEMMIAAAVIGLTSLFFLKEAVIKLVVRGTYASWFLMAFAGVLGLMAWLSWRAAYRATNYLTVGRPTSISSAFDFSDDQSELFEGERRTYTLRNRAFAEAFRTGNRDLTWSPDSPAAQTAARRRKIVYFVLGAAVFVWVIWEALSSLFPLGPGG